MLKIRTIKKNNLNELEYETNDFLERLEDEKCNIRSIGIEAKELVSVIIYETPKSHLSQLISKSIKVDTPPIYEGTTENGYLVQGSLVYHKSEDQYYIVEHSGDELSYPIEKDSIKLIKDK